MRFAVNIPNFGDFADPRVVAELAREVTTLDRLTGGRMILGVGLGAPINDEFGSFGEPVDAKVLAARLDEGLFILNELWSGSSVTFHGTQLDVDDVTFLPVPVQRPRVPIWAGGEWPARPPMRRAARWDGAVPIQKGEDRQLDAAMVRAVHAFLRECREEAGLAAEPFDLSLCGSSTPESAAEIVGPLEQEGATWWQECQWDDRLEQAEPMFRRVAAGPPLAG
jgi:alkanesulfonate monooxygenase SsuD/methylene tetrahydromethanopterin reductase-like flavin-dependent oxidoreductase (luciferase family)